MDGVFKTLVKSISIADLWIYEMTGSELKNLFEKVDQSIILDCFLFQMQNVIVVTPAFLLSLTRWTKIWFSPQKMLDMLVVFGYLM